ncbi:unnamed protein product [Acanthoscelides obtectus]|uniref:Geminin n=1 Tax=Acanthoscelides obtectus TaxID=200917 RepID=A0A9P0KLI2_ACAOB|nr:unnamed protein product [Acanthoscelides obtectus]CAK1623658.1 hypothetical protein AOBTE_LOCUS2109 [Acanthoscelides obtectus]
MKTAKKVIIKIASDDQITDNSRRGIRTLRDIQQPAIDKENLGRYTSMKDVKINKIEKTETRKPKLLMQHKCIQVGDSLITAEDLTSDEPSADYWKKLAETTQDALNSSIQENEKLKEDIAILQEENKVCKEMLEESKHLVEVLQVDRGLRLNRIEELWSKSANQVNETL